jgi:hypothetical protein
MLHQRGFSQTSFTGDEDELARGFQGVLKPSVQLLDLAPAADKAVRLLLAFGCFRYLACSREKPVSRGDARSG